MWALISHRLRRLLHDEVLGDQKPTQFLIRLKSLANNDATTPTDLALVKTIFMQQLPPTVQQILAPTSDSTSLEALAEMTDNIMLVNRDNLNKYSSNSESVNAIKPNSYQNNSFPLSQSSQNYATQPQPFSSYPQSDSAASQNALLEKISSQLANLTCAIDQLVAQNQASNHFNSYQNQSRSRSRNPRGYNSQNSGQFRSSSPAAAPRSASPNDASRSSTALPAIEAAPNLCFYHSRYGDNATKCRKGCVHFSGN